MYIIHTRALLAIALLAPLAGAQLDLFDWVVEDAHGGWVTATADGFQIVGADDATGGSGKRTVTLVKARAPTAGVVSAHIDWVNHDIDTEPIFDAAVTVTADGPTLVQLGVDLHVVEWAFEGSWDVSFEVAEGQWFGFGVWTEDSSFGEGVADVSAVHFEPATFSVTKAGAHDPRLLRADPVAADDVLVDPGPFLGLPDVDGDGVGDLAATLTVGSDQRGVQVLSGATGAVVAELPPWPGDTHDHWLDLVGDLDGDRLADLAVGSEAHLTEIYSTGTWELLLVIDEFATHRGVAGLDDLDGDGVPDLGVARDAFNWDQLFALSGADGSTLWYVNPDSANDYGEELVLGDDVDGDGLADMALIQAGQFVHAVSSADGETLWTIPGASLRDLQAIPDMDGDGLRDLFVSVGAGYRLLSAADGATIRDIAAPASLEPLGRPSAGRDVDGDGVPDVLMAGGTAPLGGTHALVALSLADGSEVVRVEQPLAVPDAFGDFVALIDDVDGDGRADAVTSRRSWSDAEVWPTSAEILVLRGLHRTEGAPLFTADGSLDPGSSWTLTLTGALPGAAVMLVVGASRLDVPFRGGVLVPANDIVLFTLADETGGLQVHVPAPGTPPPPWTQVWVQAWSEHDVTPGGPAASRAVVITVP